LQLVEDEIKQVPSGDRSADDKQSGPKEPIAELFEMPRKAHFGVGVFVPGHLLVGGGFTLSRLVGRLSFVSGLDFLAEDSH